MMSRSIRTYVNIWIYGCEYMNYLASGREKVNVLP